jgi:hypothetical protein
MDHTTKKSSFEQVIASVSFSGVDPKVRILRKDSQSETFSEVEQVSRLADLRRNGSGGKTNFIRSVLESRKAKFVPSLVVVECRTGERRELDDVIGIEILSGCIENIGELRQGNEAHRRAHVNGNGTG